MLPHVTLHSSSQVLLTIACMLCLIVCGQDSVSAQVEGTVEQPARKFLIGTRHVPPFAIKNAEGEVTWSGISIELWRAIAADLQIEFEIREIQELPALLDAVESSAVNAGVAAISVTADREQKMDFTMPFYTSGIGVAVRKTERDDFLYAIASLFSWNAIAMAFVIFCVVFAIGALAWFFEHRRNAEHFDQSPVKGIWDGFWFAAVTMTTVGYGDKSPKTIPGRLLALLWMFIGIVLISVMTAAAASVLTQSQMQTRIYRSDDLLRYRCGTVSGTTNAQFLIDEHISFQTFASVGELIDALVAKSIDVAVYDAPTLRYYAYQQLGGAIEILPVRFESASYAFALPPESPYRERINRSLLKTIESPGWHDRVERLLGR